MLKFLNISNFAVIHHLRVDFNHGLNVLTGETGSGKSIIVEALGLLLGARSSSTQIRTGERMAFVEGVFEAARAQQAVIRDVLAAAEIEHMEGDEMIVRREIYASGRSRNFINDQSVTVAALRALQPHLVEIHGQGEQRALLSAQSHLELLDAFAGSVELRAEVAEAFQSWRAAQGALRALESDLAERERLSDLIEYQLREIASVGPQVGEEEVLLAERHLLANAEKILQLTTSAYTELYESDESVLSRLAVIRRQVEKLGELDARVRSILELLVAAIESLTGVAEALRGSVAGRGFSPARLGEVEHRLAELERLKRKYHTDLQGLSGMQEELAARLKKFNEVVESEGALRESLERAGHDYGVAAGRLSSIRREAAPRLERHVIRDLRQVAMEHARFVVSIRTAPLEAPAPDASEPAREGVDPFHQTGADRVEFQLSANPGEDPRPLAQIASGGELSRLMLTLRTVCKGDAGPGHTVVFDEIDAGIGGRVAEAVGRRLRDLSATRQVLCVTHQAQIARFADYHYAVAKRLEGGRTVTTVRALDRDDRVGELSRMIGGAEDVASTREAARWLLEAPPGSEGRLSRRKRSPGR